MKPFNNDNVNEQEVVKMLEQLLARKEQIKEELNALEQEAEALEKEREEKTATASDQMKEKEINDDYANTSISISSKEAVLMGELLEINAASRSLASRRLKGAIKYENILKLKEEGKTEKPTDTQALVNEFIKMGKLISTASHTKGIIPCIPKCTDCVTSACQVCTACPEGCWTGCVNSSVIPEPHIHIHPK